MLVQNVSFPHKTFFPAMRTAPPLKTNNAIDKASFTARTRGKGPLQASFEMLGAYVGLLFFLAIFPQAWIAAGGPQHHLKEEDLHTIAEQMNAACAPDGENPFGVRDVDGDGHDDFAADLPREGTLFCRATVGDYRVALERDGVVAFADSNTLDSVMALVGE